MRAYQGAGQGACEADPIGNARSPPCLTSTPPKPPNEKTTMQTNSLTLDTIHLLSDDLAEDFRQQLEFAIADCRQRPALAKKREVHIRLEITPHPQDPDDVLIQPITTRKTPSRVIGPIRGRRGQKDQLLFDFESE